METEKSWFGVQSTHWAIQYMMAHKVYDGISGYDLMGCFHIRWQVSTIDMKIFSSPMQSVYFT